MKGFPDNLWCMFINHEYQGCTPRPGPGKNSCPGPPWPRQFSRLPRPEDFIPALPCPIPPKKILAPLRPEAKNCCPVRPWWIHRTHFVWADVKICFALHLEKGTWSKAPLSCSFFPIIAGIAVIDWMKKMAFAVDLFNQVCEAKAKQVCPNYWEMSKHGAQANIYSFPGPLYFVCWMKIKTQTLEKTDWCKESTFGKNSLEIFDKPFFSVHSFVEFFCDYTKQEGHWHM